MLGRATLIAAGLAALGLLAAGCGGGTSSPGVASLGPSTTTTSQSASGGAQSQTPVGGDNATAFVAFAHCMDSHGVQVQIAPGGKGIGISAGGGAGGPSSPKFLTAQKDCDKLLPGGGPKPLTPAEQAENEKALLELAQCMRTHGYPNFPDPSSDGAFDLSASDGFDPSSPQFNSAMTSCQPKGVRMRIAIKAQGPPPGSAPASAGGT